MQARQPVELGDLAVAEFKLHCSTCTHILTVLYPAVLYCAVQVRQLIELGDLAIAASRNGGDAKLAFKGKAYKNAAEVSAFSRERSRL